MASIEDHSYLKVCAELARLRSISLASARRKVELVASKEGLKDLASRKAIAARLLEEVKTLSLDKNGAIPNQLDELLVALAEDENFMVED